MNFRGFVKKLAFACKSKCIFLIRPLIGNRQYTKRYIELLRRQGVDIAPFDKCGFIATTVYFDKYDFSKIHIGRNCFITHDVILLVHDQSLITAWNIGGGGILEKRICMLNDISIGDNVFIGMRSIVLPGTTIGNDVIIGSGAVVKGVIPSGTVWAGNPAKMIKTTEQYREQLISRGTYDNAVVKN